MTHIYGAVGRTRRDALQKISLEHCRHEVGIADAKPQSLPSCPMILLHKGSLLALLRMRKYTRTNLSPWCGSKLANFSVAHNIGPFRPRIRLLPMPSPTYRRYRGVELESSSSHPQYMSASDVPWWRFSQLDVFFLRHPKSTVY